MKKCLFEKLSLLLSVILYLVPDYIAPVCHKMKPDGSPMGCFYSAHLVMKLAVYIFIINLIMILVSKYSIGKIIRILGSIVTIIIAALVYMIPHKIIRVTNEVGKEYGFCKMPKMECVANHTFEIAGIIAGIIAIFMIVNLISLFLKKEKN